MIAERQSLGALDPNIPRKQPSRAAKTGHKWLSNRRCSPSKENEENPQSFLARLNSCSQFRSGAESNLCNSEYNQNFNPYYLSQASIASDMSFKATENNASKETCDNYKYTARLRTKNARVPLKTLALNVEPNLSTDNHIPSELRPKFFLPLDETDNVQLSISMDTESDSSFRSNMEDEFVDAFILRSSSRKSNKCRKSEPNRYQELVKRNNPEKLVLDEYLEDILIHMRKTGEKYKARVGYLNKQTEITASMRVKLVDWLVEVQDEYKLQSETLHLAVAFVDRFLSEMSVTRAKLQLLGTTCMFLAAKFEEIYPPDADEFAYVTADTYSRTEVLLMERMILKVFDCCLAVCTNHQYLTLFHEKSNMDEKSRCFSTYLSELALLDEKYLAYSPNVQAAAAISLAIATLRHARICDVVNGNLSAQSSTKETSLEAEDKTEVHNANPPHVFISSIIRSFMSDEKDDIFRCALELGHTHVEESACSHFVREKYSSSIYHCVAKITPALANTAGMTQRSPLSWDKVIGLWMT